jgi:hypothetical protein
MGRFEDCETGAWNGGHQTKKPFKLVSLRDPVSLFVSLYDYILVNHHHRKHKSDNLLFGNDTLEVHVIQMLKEIRKTGKPTTSKSIRLHSMLHTQLMFLLSRTCTENLRSKYNYSEVDVADIAPGFEDAILQYALRNLEQFDAISTAQSAEQLSISIALQLHYWFPEVVGLQDKIPNTNTADEREVKKSVISERVQKRLREEVLGGDYKLYERAIELEKAMLVKALETNS